jgi:hypothetical protein|tara:strand:+ start:913 stop:1107 length:195 start_codon:yes stop_codon:yes gene_type:complete
MRETLSNELLVIECFKADKVLMKFEKSLEELRAFKDNSNSIRIQMVLESLKDFQTSKEIEEEDI